ncbi:MAG: DsrE family protein [Myxococcales bacterium]|nr:MAG: DsrE family protein [Myxococcales bacterium]
MAKYLLIESRDPFDSNDVANFYEMASGLIREGNEVTLFLVQNGVLPARRSGASPPLTSLTRRGAEVLADDFSLRERGITEDRLAEGIQPSALDIVVDHLANGSKVIWH